MTANVEDSQYITFVSQYLENLVYFAKGAYENITDLLYPCDVIPESVSRRTAIIKVVKAYADDSQIDYLSEIIETTTDPLIMKIAVLVQSCNRIDDVISKSM
jgi:hypothetical protein